MQRCKKVFERSSLFVEPEAAGSASSPLGEKLTLRIDAQEYSRGCTARVSSYLQSLNGSINLLQPRFPKPGWRNWQTQRTQNPKNGYFHNRPPVSPYATTPIKLRLL